MTRTTAELSGLHRLTQAAYDREQARMAALSRTEAELRAQITTLTDQSRSDVAHFDAASQARAHTLWNQWIDRRMTQLSTDLAAVLAQKEALRPALAQAFGRHQVTAQLLSDHVAAKRYSAKS